MTNILIAFYSRDRSTEALALAVSEGAVSAGAKTRLRRARELVAPDIMAAVPDWVENANAMNAVYDPPSVEDAEWADGIVFGSPTRFGLVSSELKAYLDSLGGLWAQGKLAGKVGSTFTSTSSPHGGNEATNLTMFIPMAHFGMVIVPPGYADAAMFKAGTPYGASSVSYGPQKAAPTEDDLAAARFQGKRVAEIAAKLKAG